MQILLNTDAHTDGRHEMGAHLQIVVNDAMGRFGEHITRVEAHLSDANSLAKSGPDEIHCTLEARLVHLDPIVVKHHAATAHQAIGGAVTKLKRAVTTALEKHDTRHAGPLKGSAADDAVVPE